MQAIVLAGGLGTRLRDQYPDLPKALVPIAGRPFLEWQLDWLAAQGFTSVHFALGHLAQRLQSWLQAHPPPALRITSAVEDRPLGTGGALRASGTFVLGDPFFLLNGDSLVDGLDFRGMQRAHTAANNRATLAVVPIRDAGRYGTVDFDERGRVTAFREKAARSEGWVNGGVYCMDRRIFGRLGGKTPLSLEYDVFPELTARGELGVCRAEGPLLDMGTPEGIAALAAWLEAR